MDSDALAGLFLEAAVLKRVPRAGWFQRGVPHVESVAEHSFGVAFMALALADVINSDLDRQTGQAPLDLEKVMAMALLHDLAEVRLTDLPASAVKLIPELVKSRAEASAIGDLLAPLPTVGRWKTLWHEFEDQSSPEGRLVRDADKLEMMVQCLSYEQAGSRGLDEYWNATDQRAWHYAISGELYSRLREMRPGFLGA
jgi:putative hydrolase of HD superfamily